MINSSMRFTRNRICLELIAVASLAHIFFQPFNIGALYSNRGTILHVAKPKQQQDHKYAYTTTKAVNYGWYGKNWAPPPGIPFFSGSEISRLFQSENTLWMGDSTARQDYHTMYNVMNANNPDNVRSDDLNKNINKNQASVNSGGALTEALNCPSRYPTNNKCKIFPCIEGLNFVDMGQVKGTDGNCFSSDKNNTTDNATFYETGKFDLTSTICFRDTNNMMKQDAATMIQSNYSVLIVSMGIWEVVRPHTCRFGNTTVTGRLVEVLENLQQISGPSLFVIWKTHGPSSVEERDHGAKTMELVSQARQWFEQSRPKYMDIIDVGGAVMHANRAFSIDRIQGDLEAHWGTEARTLSIQMASHALYMKRERNGME